MEHRCTGSITPVLLNAIDLAGGAVQLVALAGGQSLCHVLNRPVTRKPEHRGRRVTIVPHACRRAAAGPCAVASQRYTATAARPSHTVT